MRLRRHLSQVHDLLVKREEIVVEALRIEETVPNRRALIMGSLRFWNGSRLEFTETLVEQGVILIKTDYAYHYQDANARLIFRYDNAPHHRQVSTFPHHKHTTAGVTEAQPPHLVDVLREVDEFLYRHTG